MRFVKLILKLFIVQFAFSSASLVHAAEEHCVAAPPLPEPDNRVVTVSSVKQLNRAVQKLRNNTTIVIKPGRYQLTDTIEISADNVTIRGSTADCSSVELLGPGMDIEQRNGIDHAFWINGKNTTIANLTAGEVYFHTIQINATAVAPRIYNVRLYNSGQQFIKSNPLDFGVGVDNGIVEYSVMEYTDKPSLIDRDGSGTGYTNGVDVHAGGGWRISNNLFRNFHTPDDADHLWNPAVLIFNGARDTITENNVFINVDRAIAYGISDHGNDHSGGIIRNNMIVMEPNLFSRQRSSMADAPIVLWDSPGTKVLHNTILNSGNTPLSIELRFGSTDVEVANNLADAPISHRNSQPFIARNNMLSAKPNWFINPPKGNLRLRPKFTSAIDKVRRHKDAIYDVDLQERPAIEVDLGADEYKPSDQSSLRPTNGTSGQLPEN